MPYTESQQKLNDLRERIAALRKEMRAVQAKVEPEQVQDYTLAGSGGQTVHLKDLFGSKDTLFVIHNMGTGCSYCTLWADGFNGVYEHLRDRASFIVTSPDSPEKQQAFASSRGWRFPMFSHAGTTFAADLGYRKDERFWPGVSVLKLAGENIVRVSDTQFGPDDDFCVVWHFFDLLPEGPDGWKPKYKYV